MFYSILFYPITLEGRRDTTDKFATIPFHLDLFSAALVELAKSITVHSLILSSHLFFCLPLFLFPFTVPCRIVFAKPEDLETYFMLNIMIFLYLIVKIFCHADCLDQLENLENRTNLKIKIIDARICNTSIISRWIKDGWQVDLRPFQQYFSHMRMMDN